MQTCRVTIAGILPTTVTLSLNGNVSLFFLCVEKFNNKNLTEKVIADRGQKSNGTNFELPAGKPGFAYRQFEFCPV